MIPSVVRSLLAAVCFDYHTSKLISHYLRIHRFYLELQGFSELPNQENGQQLRQESRAWELLTEAYKRDQETALV